MFRIPGILRLDRLSHALVEGGHFGFGAYGFPAEGRSKGNSGPFSPVHPQLGTT